MVSTNTWTWQLLQAGSFRLDGGSMFGIIPKVLWTRSTSCDEDNRITLQTNCVYLTDGSQRVLIETGYGDKFGEKEKSIFALEDRSITDALAEINVDPADLTDIILTHLHFDHAGGLTRRDPKGGETPVPTFPNARIHTQRREWDDALANRTTMTKTYLRSHLDPVLDQIEFHEGEAEVIPGIRVFPVPGHTWGQQAVMFHDNEGPLVFPGDVMPTTAHAGLPYNMAYDVEPYTNTQTKTGLFERCEAGNVRWIIDHDPESPVVRVRRADAKTGPPWRLVRVPDSAG